MQMNSSMTFIRGKRCIDIEYKKDGGGLYEFIFALRFEINIYQNRITWTQKSENDMKAPLGRYVSIDFN